MKKVVLLGAILSIIYLENCQITYAMDTKEKLENAIQEQKEEATISDFLKKRAPIKRTNFDNTKEKLKTALENAKQSMIDKFLPEGTTLDNVKIPEISAEANATKPAQAISDNQVAVTNFFDNLKGEILNHQERIALATSIEQNKNNPAMLTQISKELKNSSNQRFGSSPTAQAMFAKSDASFENAAATLAAALNLPELPVQYIIDLKRQFAIDQFLTESEPPSVIKAIVSSDPLQTNARTTVLPEEWGEYSKTVQSIFDNIFQEYDIENYSTILKNLILYKLNVVREELKISASERQKFKELGYNEEYDEIENLSKNFKSKQFFPTNMTTAKISEWKQTYLLYKIVEDKVKEFRRRLGIFANEEVKKIIPFYEKMKNQYDGKRIFLFASDYSIDSKNEQAKDVLTKINEQLSKKDYNIDNYTKHLDLLKGNKDLTAWKEKAIELFDNIEQAIKSKKEYWNSNSTKEQSYVELKRDADLLEVSKPRDILNNLEDFMNNSRVRYNSAVDVWEKGLKPIKKEVESLIDGSLFSSIIRNRCRLESEMQKKKEIYDNSKSDKDIEYNLADKIIVGQSELDKVDATKCASYVKVQKITEEFLKNAKQCETKGGRSTPDGVLIDVNLYRDWFDGESYSKSGSRDVKLESLRNSLSDIFSKNIDFENDYSRENLLKEINQALLDSHLVDKDIFDCRDLSESANKLISLLYAWYKCASNETSESLKRRYILLKEAFKTTKKLLVDAKNSKSTTSGGAGTSSSKSDSDSDSGDAGDSGLDEYTQTLKNFVGSFKKMPDGQYSSDYCAVDSNLEKIKNMVNHFRTLTSSCYEQTLLAHYFSLKNSLDGGYDLSTVTIDAREYTILKTFIALKENEAQIKQESMADIKEFIDSLTKESDNKYNSSFNKNEDGRNKLARFNFIWRLSRYASRPEAKIAISMKSVQGSKQQSWEFEDIDISIDDTLYQNLDAWYKQAVLTNPGGVKLGKSKTTKSEKAILSPNKTFFEFVSSFKKSINADGKEIYESDFNSISKDNSQNLKDLSNDWSEANSMQDPRRLALGLIINNSSNPKISLERNQFSLIENCSIVVSDGLFKELFESYQKEETTNQYKSLEDEKNWTTYLEKLKNAWKKEKKGIESDKAKYQQQKDNLSKVKPSSSQDKKNLENQIQMLDSQIKKCEEKEKICEKKINVLTLLEDKELFTNKVPKDVVLSEEEYKTLKLCYDALVESEQIGKVASKMDEGGYAKLLLEIKGLPAALRVKFETILQDIYEGKNSFFVSTIERYFAEIKPWEYFKTPILNLLTCYIDLEHSKELTDAIFSVQDFGKIQTELENLYRYLHKTPDELKRSIMLEVYRRVKEIWKQSHQNGIDSIKYYLLEYLSSPIDKSETGTSENERARLKNEVLSKIHDRKSSGIMSKFGLDDSFDETVKSYRKSAVDISDSIKKWLLYSKELEIELSEKEAKLLRECLENSLTSKFPNEFQNIDDLNTDGLDELEIKILGDSVSVFTTEVSKKKKDLTYKNLKKIINGGMNDKEAESTIKDKAIERLQEAKIMEDNPDMDPFKEVSTKHGELVKKLTKNLSSYFKSKWNRIDDVYDTFKKNLDDKIKSSGNTKIKLSDLLAIMYGDDRRVLFESIEKCNEELSKSLDASKNFESEPEEIKKIKYSINHSTYLKLIKVKCLSDLQKVVEDVKTSLDKKRTKKPVPPGANMMEQIKLARETIPDPDALSLKDKIINLKIVENYKSTFDSKVSKNLEDLIETWKKTYENVSETLQLLERFENLIEGSSNISRSPFEAAKAIQNCLLGKDKDEDIAEIARIYNCWDGVISNLDKEKDSIEKTYAKNYGIYSPIKNDKIPYYLSLLPNFIFAFEDFSDEKNLLKIGIQSTKDLDGAAWDSYKAELEK